MPNNTNNYEEELSTMAQRGVESAKDLSSTAFDKATRAAQASQGYLDQMCQQSRQYGDQAYDTTKHYWNNVPLFRWSVYVLGAILAIPLVLFIITVGSVSIIASLPAIGFFTFVAIIVGFLAVLAWGGFQGINVIWSKLDQKDLTEHVKQKSAAARDTLKSVQSEYQTQR